MLSPSGEVVGQASRNVAIAPGKSFCPGCVVSCEVGAIVVHSPGDREVAVPTKPGGESPGARLSEEAVPGDSAGFLPEPVVESPVPVLRV